MALCKNCHTNEATEVVIGTKPDMCAFCLDMSFDEGDYDWDEDED